MVTDRRKKIVLGTSSGYAGILVTNLFAVISVPITLSYFGGDRYGALALVMTLVNYLSVTNFGIPTACAVLASKTIDRKQQLSIICRSFLLLAVISLFALSLFMVISGFPSWLSLLGKIPESISDEVGRAVYWTAVLFLLNLLTAPFLTGFIANQKVHIERLYATLSANSYVVALFYTIYFKGNLVDYAIARGGLVLLCNMMGTCHSLFEFREVIERHRKYNGIGFLSSPSDENSAKAIFLTGGRMFTVGLAALVVWQTDNLVISHYLGIGAITPYQITFKLITMLYIIFTAINPAISPHFGRAWATGEFGWISGTYNHIALLSTLLGGLVWLGAVAFARDVVTLWAGTNAYGGPLMVFSLGGYGYVLSLVSVNAALLSSLNMVRNLPLISWAEAALNLVLSIALIRILGAGGVALGTFLASLMTVYWLIPREIKRRTSGTVILSWNSIIRQGSCVLLPALVAVIIVNQYFQSDFTRIGINLTIVTGYMLISLYILPSQIKIIVRELLDKFFTRGSA